MTSVIFILCLNFLDSEGEVPEQSLKNLSARHQVFLELLQTESNYVGILNTIMTVSFFMLIFEV